MPLHIHDSLTWAQVARRLRGASPEAFADLGQPLNLIGGRWGEAGNGKSFVSPVDGSTLGRLPMIGLDVAQRAVAAAADEFPAWAATPLDERIRRVREWLVLMRQHRQTLALSLAWELGKPYASGLTSVDRTIGGVEWYCEQIGAMLDSGGTRREPLGLVSNIASWNYPLSVLVHTCIVQALAGNSVIAKTPTDGGAFSITVSFALARACGIPVSLVSGSGGQLSEALIRGESVACFSFVGGKTIGRDIAARMLKPGMRHMLEMEGVNAYGVWDFGDWPTLAKQLRKGFEFGKQRCTAYVRFVVQRGLLPAFLEMHRGVVESLRIGHPLATPEGSMAPPELDFGPLINAAKVEELHGNIVEATHGGALELYRGRLDDALFLPGQDRSAYMAPALLVNIPRKSTLYFNEPFGPVDTIMVVDTLDQLIDEMNVSNGNLVASIATADAKVAERVRAESRAFKFGVNQVRSRGDKEEAFGGIGQSWKGCFVGGAHLVRAVTRGPAGEQLAGNFADYTRLPESV
jgi:acyl-CoA reductase-like NAD-dependent aldehyde dehydrogenase